MTVAEPFYKSLPLDTPWTLMIDPTNKCNFQCTFCPTGDAELLKSAQRPLGMMSHELFCKIIDDLRDFKSKVRSLRLFKDGEPFLNRNLLSMLRYAKQAEVADELYIISNGSLITKDNAIGLLEAGLDRLRISVEHVSSEKYKQITRTYGNYERIVANVKFLFEERNRRGSKLFINPKILDTGLTDAEKQKFRDDFGPISDEQTIETLMGWSDSASKDWTLGTNPVYGIDSRSVISNINVCNEPFKGLAINSDGTVSVCCVDWSHGTLVGDVKIERLIDIWNGEKLAHFRMQHLQGKRHLIKACADCQYLKGHKPFWHLDAHVNEITPLFEQLQREAQGDAAATKGKEAVHKGVVDPLPPTSSKGVLRQIID